MQRASPQAFDQSYYTLVIFNFTHNFLIILHAAFLWSNSLLFGIPAAFQQTNCSVDVICPLDRLPVIRIVFFLVSKQILRARVFSEQVFVLQIRFVSYSNNKFC